MTLGCMSWGDPARGGHPWVLDEDAGRAIIKDALEAGINFFDTANVYSGGSSEEITGRALRDFAPREDVVIATKVHGRMRPGPERRGPVPQGDPARDRRSRCAGSAPTTSTSTRSTAGTTRTPIEETHGGAARRGARPARRATSAPRRCTPGSSPRRSTSPTSAAGRGSSPCRTTTTCSTARRSGRCCRSAGPGHRRDPVEPAGPRPADPRLGHRHRPRRDRRVRRHALPRRGPRDRGHRRRGGRAARRTPRPGGAGLAAAPARRHLPDRRRHQAPAPRATPSPPSTWSCPTTRSPSSAPATARTPSPATARPQRPPW